MEPLLEDPQVREVLEVLRLLEDLQALARLQEQLQEVERTLEQLEQRQGAAAQEEVQRVLEEVVLDQER